MKALLGRKIGMSQMFSEAGNAVAVTLVVAAANDVVLRRTVDKDGHAALQLGLPRHNSKEIEGGDKLTPSRLKRKYQMRREFSIEADEGVKTMTVGQFTAGDMVEIVGTAKGKGFQGVVKRHKMKGGPASHGHRHVLRRPGSIGSRFPQHVLKGKRMAGRMGGQRVTVKNLKIAWIDEAKQLLAIEGAIPGPKGSVVEVRGIAEIKE